MYIYTDKQARTRGSILCVQTPPEIFGFRMDIIYLFYFYVNYFILYFNIQVHNIALCL